MTEVIFESLFLVPQKNGLTRPKSVRGAGTKMVNMGELFAYDRIWGVPMERVPLSEQEQSFLLNPGDLLFARQSLVREGAGRCVLFRGDSEEVTFESHIIRVRLDAKRADSSFYYYWFRSLRGRQTIETIINQVAAAGIRGSDLARLPVPCPALREQETIVQLLSALDDKIELNQRTNETLETMARALFKSWFIDFDPVRAKMAGLAPAGMDAATAALFPGALDEEARPLGWRKAGLGSWAEALSGGTPSKGDSSLWNGAIPWISPKVMTEVHADRAEAHVAESAIGNGTRLAPAGSTLVMVRGMGLHEKVRISQARREVTFNQDVKALVPRGIEPSLLLFALLHGQEQLLGKVESSGHGTGKLPTEILLGYQITMPPREVQARLTKVFDDINARIASAREESQTLAALRDLLLPRLLSGEVRIRDAEREVGKVA